MVDKAKVQQRLGEALGDPTLRVVIPKQFLANLGEILTKQNEELAVRIRENNISKELIEENRKTHALLEELKAAVVANRVDRVEVANFPPPPKFPPVKIPPAKEVKIPAYPTTIDLREPKWYRPLQDKFLGFIADGIGALRKSFAQDLDSHMEKEKALAVRLVDTEGKTFYNAMFYGGGGGGSVAAAAGGGVDPVGLKNVAAVTINPATEDTLALIKAKTDNLDVLLSTRTKAADQQHVIVDSGGPTTVTANQGTPAVAANRWPVILEDSSNAALDLTTGGQTGAKVMVVGDGDKYVRGILAHGVADTGIEPIVTGSKAASSAPTAVSSGQVVRQYMDTQGRLFVTADKTGTFQTVETAPTGALSDGSVTLTLANTAYAVPDSAVPTSAYILIVSSNIVNTTEMRWRVTSGTILGNPIAPGATVTIRLPASQPLYLYSTAAGQIANYSRMTI